MSYRIVTNKKNTAVLLHFSASNTGILIAGNSSTGNVAVDDTESIGGGYITKVWGGADPTGYWKIARGANTVAVIAGEQGFTDFSGTGAPLKLDITADLSANLIGATDGYLMIEVRKTSATGGDIVGGRDYFYDGPVTP